MFYYRHTIDGDVYDKEGCRLYELVAEGEAELIGKGKGQVRIYKYFNEVADTFDYFMIDHSVEPGSDVDFCNSFMGFCALSRLKGWQAVETNILYVSPNFRRRGVATQLYDAILDDGQIVICGWSHNPKSRALWMNLVQNPKYVVWAQDMQDLDRTSDVWIDEEGKMVCNLKVYVDIKKQTKKKPKEDVRLIAINPKKV